MTHEEIRELREAAELLGIPEEYDEEMLRKAYKKYVHDWHPDVATKRGVSPEDANRKMTDGNKAQAVLKRALGKSGQSFRIPSMPTEPEPDANRGEPSSRGTASGTARTRTSTRGTTRNQTHTQTRNYADYDDDDEDDWVYGSGSRGDDEDRGSQEKATTGGATTQGGSTFWQMFDDMTEPVSNTPIKLTSFPVKILRLLLKGFEIGAVLLVLLLVVESVVPEPGTDYGDGLVGVIFLKALSLLPALIVWLGGLFVGLWAYREASRLILDFADISDGIATALDVAVAIAMFLFIRPRWPVIVMLVTNAIKLIT